MRTTFKNDKLISFIFSIYIIVFFNSCVAPISLTSSWTNKKALSNSNPKIMIMAIGKKLEVKQEAENTICGQFKKENINCVPSLDFFTPSSAKYDSITMIKVLMENKIDLLLTNAVVDVIEKENYVPGSTTTSPVFYNPNQTYSFGINSYYGYYGYRNDFYYGKTYQTRTTEGNTTTEVEVLIESNLYDIKNGELIWVGQSKSLTREPSKILFAAFAKNIIQDLYKSNLLIKKTK